MGSRRRNGTCESATPIHLHMYGKGGWKRPLRDQRKRVFNSNMLFLLILACFNNRLFQLWHVLMLSLGGTFLFF